jgi:hypothetical protein
MGRSSLGLGLARRNAERANVRHDLPALRTLRDVPPRTTPRAIELAQIGVRRERVEGGMQNIE